TTVSVAGHAPVGVGLPAQLVAAVITTPTSFGLGRTGSWSDGPGSVALASATNAPMESGLLSAMLSQSPAASSSAMPSAADVVSPASAAVTLLGSSDHYFMALNGQNQPVLLSKGWLDLLTQASMDSGLRVETTEVQSGETTSWQYFDAI